MQACAHTCNAYKHAILLQCVHTCNHVTTLPRYIHAYMLTYMQSCVHTCNRVTMLPQYIHACMLTHMQLCGEFTIYMDSAYIPASSLACSPTSTHSYFCVHAKPSSVLPDKHICIYLCTRMNRCLHAYAYFIEMDAHLHACLNKATPFRNTLPNMEHAANF